MHTNNPPNEFEAGQRGKIKPMPILKLNLQNPDLSKFIAQHDSHSSHDSHNSHDSHSSHSSHYSHDSGGMYA
jgi:hypothetical protein